MVVFQTAKLRRGVRMFRATRSTADSRQIITILTTRSVFRAPDQPPTRSALLTPNWRGCEGTSVHFARPPVQGLDFEVDVRGVAHELVI